MNTDVYGLPVQADGDANDQLQRVGMVLTAHSLGAKTNVLLYVNCAVAARSGLQPKPGVYTRYVGGETNNVSADQLMPILAYWIARGNTRQVFLMFIRMVYRLGFAQNYKDGLSGTDRTKIPDFMALRALPLFCRAHWLLYPLAVMSDLLLVFAALAACGPVWRDDKGFTKRDPNDSDDNVIVATLAVCRARMPTPLSYLASRIYGKYRPWNYGCQMSVKYGNEPYHPVYGALRWYHSKQFGGNPEIAELWKPICERYFE